jgi:hypothetical protein
MGNAKANENKIGIKDLPYTPAAANNVIRKIGYNTGVR